MGLFMYITHYTRRSPALLIWQTELNVLIMRIITPGEGNVTTVQMQSTITINAIYYKLLNIATFWRSYQ